MAKKKKSFGILHGRSTITGTKHRPSSLKPQKTRELIRRYHVLQKLKFSMIAKLKQELKLKEIDSEDSFEVALKASSSELFKTYKRSYDEFKALKVARSEGPLADAKTLDIDLLLSCLGKINAELAFRGGIDAYQAASTHGQDKKRGGDSSKRLITWLRESKYQKIYELNEPLSALEIGSLDPRNNISTCGIFQKVVRIDLRSNNSLILEQDFMERPLPISNEEKFNMISCSLVINFVPSPTGRGLMLRRITEFLKEPTSTGLSSLFLVLPLPCIANSRYFDKNTLDSIMQALGFTQTFYYEAKKLSYWLYDWGGSSKMKQIKIQKKIVHPGVSRNNFCIVME
ncbi:uncharacterized protein PRCAT00000226001 [Priceomyces carsonii]|uniref:uncharacterized protein n=1 Tax=Priceomyces carsonii TaxID=28549 RepID=UPI002EDAFB42|nr:unnamed protein product [Priceomyces carsonii]